MDRDEVEVHKHAKKERGQYPAILTEQAWSIKDLLYGTKHQNMINFPCGMKPVSRAGKMAPSCPLRMIFTLPKFKQKELALMIKLDRNCAKHDLCYIRTAKHI